MAKAKTPRNSTTKTQDEGPESLLTAVVPPPAKTVAKRTRKASTAVLKPVNLPNLEEEIRRRAYELWEQHGHPSGYENEHWLIAEQEIRARHREQSPRSA